MWLFLRFVNQFAFYIGLFNIHNIAMIMIDITVLRVDKVLAFTTSIFFFIAILKFIILMLTF